VALKVAVRSAVNGGSGKLNIQRQGKTGEALPGDCPERKAIKK